MTAALLHDALAVAGCYGLWRLWRIWFGGGDRRVAAIAGIGFLLRALLGQALFWISYLRLPVARPLQLGDGLWFYSIDGWWYLRDAQILAGRGPEAILFLDRYYASHFFVQVLSTWVEVFGGAASVALFLNCAAYLATCALVVRLNPSPRLRGEGAASAADEGRHPAAVAPHPALRATLSPRSGARDFALLFALALGPGTLIWSLQPLKDTLFALLIVSFLFVCARWRELPMLWHAATIIALGFAMAGIRWYFALIVWAAFAVFLAMTTPRRASAWVLFAVLALAVWAGAAEDFFPTRAFRRPTRIIVRFREGFERAPGETTIVPGPYAGKLIAGAAAAVLPRAIAQPIGLVRIGGGRGLWAVAELDTIAFDAVLVFAIVALVRGRFTPLTVFVLLVLVATGGPMIYAVNNFGTLFRLRSMLYVLAAVVPVTLGPDSRP